jgi:hypothetical protein
MSESRAATACFGVSPGLAGAGHAVGVGGRVNGTDGIDEDLHDRRVGNLGRQSLVGTGLCD